MDVKKVGQFLKELRKQNNMTQEQLGEKIGVTNKTVSRWETGEYMPPIENLKLLSDIYQVSINEILAGERLEMERYRDAAEDNITVALEEMETKVRIFQRNMLIIMGVTSVLAIMIIFLLPDFDNLPTSEKIKEIIVCLLVIAMAFISNTLNITLNIVAMALNKNR